MLRRSGSRVATTLVLTIVVFATRAVAQVVPSDFALHAEAGGRFPGVSVGRIDVAGTTVTTAVVPPEARATGTATVTGTVALTASMLSCLYAAVTGAGSLTATSPANPDVLDGTYAVLRVTAGGTTNVLVARNQAFAPIDDVIRRLNSLVPPGAQLGYNAIAGSASVTCP